MSASGPAPMRSAYFATKLGQRGVVACPRGGCGEAEHRSRLAVVQAALLRAASGLRSPTMPARPRPNRDVFSRIWARASVAGPVRKGTQNRGRGGRIPQPGDRVGADDRTFFDQIGRQIVAFGCVQGRLCGRHRLRRGFAALPDWPRTAPWPRPSSPSSSVSPAPAWLCRADRVREADRPAIAARRHRRWSRPQGRRSRPPSIRNRWAACVWPASSRIIAANMSFNRW